MKSRCHGCLTSISKRCEPALRPVLHLPVDAVVLHTIALRGELHSMHAVPDVSHLFNVCHTLARLRDVADQVDGPRLGQTAGILCIPPVALLEPVSILLLNREGSPSQQNAQPAIIASRLPRRPHASQSALKGGDTEHSLAPIIAL